VGFIRCLEILQTAAHAKERLVTVTSSTAANMTWTPPEDCHGNVSSTSQPISFRTSAEHGRYIIYQESALPDQSTPPTHVVARLSYTASNIAFSSLTADTGLLFLHRNR